MKGNIVHVEEGEFQSTISKGVVLVDFYADWCGPCRMMTPVLEQLAQDIEGKVTIAKVNVDDSQNVASLLGITSIPTLVIFKNGEEFSRVVGVKDLDTLKNLVNKAL